MLAEGYQFKTTYWNDFSIADKFGVDAVKDTYRKVLPQARINAMDFAELVCVLNWKIWEHYENHNESLASTYNVLWDEADRMIDTKNFSKEDVRKMLRFLD